MSGKTLQYGTQLENGDVQIRKNLKDARFWAKVLSRPSLKTPRPKRTVVVVRPVGEWVFIEEPARDETEAIA